MYILIYRVQLNAADVSLPRSFRTTSSTSRDSSGCERSTGTPSTLVGRQKGSKAKLPFAAVLPDAVSVSANDPG